jgi:glycosyltransferase involved in cell wall biosynthesis
LELVSCILATKDRPAFARQALRCFQRQTYPATELIVVDDGQEKVEEIFRDQPGVRYLRLEEPASLGRKLNLGIAQAAGDILQKLDDDDFYHPDFLHRAVSALGPSSRSVVAWGCFLVLLRGEERLRFSGPGWAAGGTLCFRRALWQQTPFHDTSVGEDWFFLAEAQAQLSRVLEPELYILVRHGANTWRSGGSGDDDLFRAMPAYPKPLSAVVPAEDLSFYSRIAAFNPHPAELPHRRAQDPLVSL